MRTALRLTAFVKAEIWASAAAVLLSLASASAEEQKTYWDLATFQELSGLVPELPGARPRGLAPGGMELWMQNQLRLPETPSTVLEANSGNPAAWTVRFFWKWGSREKRERTCSSRLATASAGSDFS